MFRNGCLSSDIKMITKLIIVITIFGIIPASTLLKDNPKKSVIKRLCRIELKITYIILILN